MAGTKLVAGRTKVTVEKREAALAEVSTLNQHYQKCDISYPVYLSTLGESSAQLSSLLQRWGRKTLPTIIRLSCWWPHRFWLMASATSPTGRTNAWWAMPTPAPVSWQITSRSRP
jgi:hypothetical protein